MVTTLLICTSTSERDQSGGAHAFTETNRRESTGEEYTSSEIGLTELTTWA